MLKCISNEKLIHCEYDDKYKVIASTDIPAGTVVYYGTPQFIINTQCAEDVEEQLDIIKYPWLVDVMAEFYPKGNNDLLMKVEKNGFSLDGMVGMYLLASRFNHGCQPNCSWMSIGNNIIFKTIVDVKVGSELTHCYTPQVMIIESIEKRAKEMDFKCTCTLCQGKQQFNPYHFTYSVINNNRCWMCRKICNKNSIEVYCSQRCRNKKCK